MTRIMYQGKLGLQPKGRALLHHAEAVAEEYLEQGYKLTVRQLYYQLVSRNLLRNTQEEYHRLGRILTVGRMAGVIDWDAIEDRLREPRRIQAWTSPQEILDTAAKTYRVDRLEGQPVYVEVWVEKDALSEVLQRTTDPWGVTVMVNRGYSSTTAMHESYQRFLAAFDRKQRALVLYLGDHDPSGLDMVCDILKRLSKFYLGSTHGFGDLTQWFTIERLGLTMEQIRTHHLPENPVKLKDRRAKEYIALHGAHSWEVDALPPRVLHELVEARIKDALDLRQYERVLQREQRDREWFTDVLQRG